jgi:hypothetical protein
VLLWNEFTVFERKLLSPTNRYCDGKFALEVGEDHCVKIDVNKVWSDVGVSIMKNGTGHGKDVYF